MFFRFSFFSLSLSPSITASAFILIAVTLTYTPLYRFPFCFFLCHQFLFFFLSPSFFSPSLSHSHLSNLNVVSLNYILNFFAKALSCLTPRYWQLFSLKFTIICSLFPCVHCLPGLLILCH